MCSPSRWSTNSLAMSYCSKFSSQFPRPCIAIHYLCRVITDTVSDDANLPMAVGAIADTIDFLLIYIQVEGAPLGDNRNQIGLIETSNNCRIRLRGYQS